MTNGWAEQTRAVGTQEYPQFRHVLEGHLLRELAEINIQSHNERVAMAVYDKDRTLLAGIDASTSYGWLHIDILWVARKHRGQGLATHLLDETFARARILECHNAWLDTSNPDARAFYINRGFELFGFLSNEQNEHPPTHQRWFMKTKIGD